MLAYSGGYVLTRRALPAGGAGLVEVALTLALVGMGVRFVPALLGVVVYASSTSGCRSCRRSRYMPAVRELRARFARS